MQHPSFDAEEDVVESRLVVLSQLDCSPHEPLEPAQFASQCWDTGFVMQQQFREEGLHPRVNGHYISFQKGLLQEASEHFRIGASLFGMIYFKIVLLRPFAVIATSEQTVHMREEDKRPHIVPIHVFLDTGEELNSGKRKIVSIHEIIPSASRVRIPHLSGQ